MLLSTAAGNATGLDFWGGAGWARIGQYINYYKAAGFDVMVGRLWKEAEMGMSIELPDKSRHFPDVILMQRMMRITLAEAVLVARANGQVVINDVDDDFWSLDERNNAYDAVRDKKMEVVMSNGFKPGLIIDNPTNRSYYDQVLAASSLITVSTPYLADKLSARFNVPIEVIPNYVDLKRFRPVVQTPGVPTFGWAGSLDHRSGDIETVALYPDVLRNPAMDGKIKLQHSGDGRHIDANAKTFHSIIGVPDEMVATLPLSTSIEYPKMLTFDVGIVPLNNVPFNHAKSDIKGLEYAACGIPFIASDLPSYRRLWEDWGGCFHLARKPQHWVGGVKRYMDFRNRQMDATTLLDRVQDRDIAYGVTKWIDLLQGAA